MAFIRVEIEVRITALAIKPSNVNTYIYLLPNNIMALIFDQIAM